MIDEYDLMPQEEPFDPFAVMLFKALQVLAFLFFVALLLLIGVLFSHFFSPFRHAARLRDMDPTA